jgi:hypothetical protein
MRKSTAVTLFATPFVLFAIACGAGSTAKSHSAGDDNQTSAAQTGADNTATATSAKATPTKAAPPTKPAGPKTVLTAHGSGIKKTAKFTTGDDWTIHWTYNCSGFFGGKGNFVVTVYTDGGLDDIAVNELGKKGSDASPEYDDAGTHYLEVNSECSWTLKVTTP